MQHKYGLFLLGFLSFFEYIVSKEVQTVTCTLIQLCKDEENTEKSRAETTDLQDLLQDLE